MEKVHKFIYDIFHKYFIEIVNLGFYLSILLILYFDQKL